MNTISATEERQLATEAMTEEGVVKPEQDDESKREVEDSPDIMVESSPGYTGVNNPQFVEQPEDR